MARLAVVLFNLGGPDHPDAIRPFLRNLFFDPAIIGVPRPIRWMLAEVISRRRAPVAGEIYAHLGGKSPLLEHTRDQAQALKRELVARQYDAEVFVSMRYWHPMSDEVVRAVQAFAPDEVVLLPLYPQFSTTTTQSSLNDWRRAAHVIKFEAPARAICCYPVLPGFVGAVTQSIKAVLTEMALNNDVDGVRILFSAHGLPKKIVARGDPYQWQVEQSAAAVMSELGATGNGNSVESVVCYQSRVGPLEWIGPATEDELMRAGRDGVGVILVPIAFVSEHSETLVELDIEYRELAEKSGVPRYHRVLTVLSDQRFISGLADLVEKTSGGDKRVADNDQARLCPVGFKRCGCLVETAISGGN